MVTKNPQPQFVLAAARVADHEDQPAAVEQAADEPSPTVTSATATTPPSPRTGRGVIADQARELVARFYELFHDSKPFHSSKSINQAIALIAQHGTELAHYVVEFARREAGKTNYQPQTFGGILQYVPRAVTEYTNENARRKAQQTTTTCTFCDRNGYATFTNEQGSGVVMQCPHNLDTIHMLESSRNWRHVPV